jgi:hypothetical protein
MEGSYVNKDAVLTSEITQFQMIRQDYAQWTGKRYLVAFSKVISRNSPEVTEQNHEVQQACY